MLVGAGLNVSVLEMKMGAQNLYQLNVTHINRQGEFLPETEPSLPCILAAIIQPLQMRDN